ncbi:1-acyl-sn-glycerol-3-phosphate acyltransferase [Mycoplasma iguanae]|uniref:1-acyl-sn-glycerol-3-phosphate acyltransferase n=1 Tax=Mycoplasma iguanae TaxID=292461 RepID=A0ABY5R885_9MOLU|nr:lysophospholipid acyltransferase family protein [Mycoplasma iguanae]UVD81521.1 1-acyl-sn-glycerol-3-phosphate acyltransferase [Mycoplasma iguanae]
MIKIKKILLAPIWVLRLLKFWKISRKYKKDKDAYAPQWRNDFILKRAEKYLKMYNISVEVKGYENLPKTGPVLLTPNHLSEADGFAMLVALKKQSEDKDERNKIATFLAKKELEQGFKSKHTLRIIDTFFIDRKNPRQSLSVLNEFGKFIKEKKTYGLIFPEGTRNKEGKIGEFKGGAFKIAKKEFLPIIPVTINNSFKAKDSSRKNKLKIEVIFHQIIKPMSILGQTNEAIANRVRKIVESKFIEAK